LDALKCMKEMKNMIPEILRLEKDVMDHQNAVKGMDGLGEFAKRLGKEQT